MFRCARLVLYSPLPAVPLLEGVGGGVMKDGSGGRSWVGGVFFWVGRKINKIEFCLRLQWPVLTTGGLRGQLSCHAQMQMSGLPSTAWAFDNRHTGFDTRPQEEAISEKF